MSIYLDYNASAPIDQTVLATMVDVYQNHIGNADSRTHDYGDQARSVVETARKQVASLLGIDATEVFFTSGSTESNNIAIQGLEAYSNECGKKHIITSSIEHKSVLETAKAMSKRGFEVDIVDPEPSGSISVNKVMSFVRPDTLLVSIMHVNNETGQIQPILELGNKLAETSTFFHIDATQSCGKLVKELKMAQYDMLSFSAHKLQGPQGVGVLVLRKKHYVLPPVKGILYGGQQEHGIRPGTIPVALVAGCGKACELAEKNNETNLLKMAAIKNLICQLLDESGVKYSINGNAQTCICNTLNICFHGVSSEALMIMTKNYCGISNGSACNSSSYSPSYVLQAMGVPTEQIEDSVRISWGPETDLNSVKEEFSKLLNAVKKMV